MKIASMDVGFHRTVRVEDGRQPSNLPPSLGRIPLYRVSKFQGKCPENWEKEGFFIALHDTEAMWMSFHPLAYPEALLIGAGGVNALTGEKLGTTLAKDNYLVAPPQPWLDGWKDTDGTVYQFVATPYEKGKGASVAEQLIGEESKTGALGIALFDPKEPGKLKHHNIPSVGWTETAFDDTLLEASSDIGSASGYSYTASLGAPSKSLGSSVRGMAAGSSRVQNFAEMGIGKGGKIIQKVYPDPHGLEIWKETPESTVAIYLVNAQVFEEITGVKVPAPKTHESYTGHWFGMKDSNEGDVAGSNKFTGLKSAVFPDSELPSEPTTTTHEEEDVIVF